MKYRTVSLKKGISKRGFIVTIWTAILRHETVPECDSRALHHDATSRDAFRRRMRSSQQKRKAENSTCFWTGYTFLSYKPRTRWEDNRIMIKKRTRTRNRESIFRKLRAKPHVFSEKDSTIGSTALRGWNIADVKTEFFFFFFVKIVIPRWLEGN